MRPNMSEEKQTTDSPTFIIASAEGGPVGMSPKPRPYKKYVIIAVSVLIATAIILTAILVGMHLFTEAQKDIIQFSFTRDHNTKEEVTSDPNTNIVQYHVNSDTYEAWVFNDFNRDIQAVKIHTDSGTSCYLTPLNRTTADDPSKIKAPAAGNKPNQNTTYHMNFISATTPISDSTFLCQTARSACNGISTYWLFPVCEGSASNPRRQKRSISISISISITIRTTSSKVSASFDGRKLEDMRPNIMSEEKQTTDSPTFIIASAEGGPVGMSPKPRPYKKYVIIAVSVLIAAAIILTAILVGMHLFTQAQKDIIQFSYTPDQNTKEEVTSDPNKNIVQYHVKSDTYEAWVFNDFNRDIQTMKIHADSGTSCYLTALNRTTADDPSKIKPPTDTKPTTNDTYYLNYISASTPISDSTFLSQTARSACSGISTYWLFPVCEGSESTSGREKRRIRFSIRIKIKVKICIHF